MFGKVVPDRTARVGRCPLCGSRVRDRKGKYGEFVGCSAYPECKWTDSLEHWYNCCEEDPESWKEDDFWQRTEPSYNEIVNG